jgi:hypothetical protein
LESRWRHQSNTGVFRIVICDVSGTGAGQLKDNRFRTR